jgi:predicted TIM-barrel fold metal-dependent hydrolase
LQTGQPIKVLAMPPYDKVIGPALKALDAKAKVEVTTWKTEGMTLAQIEISAKQIRGMKMDLVIVAIPATADAPDLESRIRSYSWVLNWSLSFGHQQWDVIAIPPSTVSPQELQLDQFAQRLIAAQDLSMIVRRLGEGDADLQAVVERWLKEQAKGAKIMNYIDAHVHVWTPDTTRYPLAAGFKKEDMKPASFTPEELFQHCKPAGVGRINLIQMSYYGFDNSYMLDMIAKHPDVFVGTAVIDPLGKDPAREMDALVKKAVRAFRIYPKLTEEPIERWLRPDGYKKMFAAGARNNQAMACLIGPDALPDLDRMCKEFPDTPVIIDHIARIGTDGKVRDVDVDRLCAMTKHKKVMVKVGAFYALGKKKPPYTDLAPLIKKVVTAFGPHRCMWESDCPFQTQGENTYQASVDLVLRRLDFLSDDEKDWLLRKTAERLFFTK